MDVSSQKIMKDDPTGFPAGASLPDPEVVGHARRRQFSSSEKHRILVAADQCTAPGAIGALLRREGIYSSHLATWRKQRAAIELKALEPQKRGPKADVEKAQLRQMTALGHENDRLRRKLAQAHLIIDVQKKVAALLDQLAIDSPSEPS